MRATQRCLAGLVIACLCLPVLADDRPLISGSPAEPGAPQGAWVGWDDLWLSSFNGPPKPAQRVFEPSLRALAQVIRESPALRDLGGFYPQIYFGVDASARPVPSGRLTLNPWWPRAVEPNPQAKGPDTAYRVKPGDVGNRPGGLALFFNWFPPTSAGYGEGLETLPWTGEGPTRFFMLPPPKRHIAGFPVLGGYLFVTPANKPPVFVPVSQERAYKAAMAWLRGQIGEVGKTSDATNEMLAHFNSAEMKNLRRQAIDEAVAREKNPARRDAVRRKAEADDQEQERQIRALAGQSTASSPIVQAAGATLAAIEAQFAALNAAQRAAPAHVKNDPDNTLMQPLMRVMVSAGTPGAVPLMAFNPNYFDPKLPAGTLQLLAMRGFTRDEITEPMKQEITMRVAIAVTEQTDWKRAAALLK